MMMMITMMMNSFQMCVLTVAQVPRGVTSKQGEDEPVYESDSIETVLSAFTSIYSGTTVGSLAVVAFVSYFHVHYVVLLSRWVQMDGVIQQIAEGFCVHGKTLMNTCLY